MKKHFTALLLFIYLVVSTSSFGQTSVISPADSVMIPNVQITLKDGTIIKGRILKSTPFIYTVETTNLGLLQIAFDDVSTITPFEESNDSSDKFEGFSITPTSYIISSNAYNLKMGENRYTNYMFFLNDFAFGISNKFSMSVSPVIIPIPFVGMFFFCAIGGKLTQPISKKINIGASLNIGAGTLGSNSAQIGSVFATYGNPNSNLTAGLSTTFISNQDNKILFQFSGTHRITKRVAILAESFFFTNHYNNYYYNSAGNYISYDEKKLGVIIIAGIKIFSPRSFFDIGFTQGSNINSSTNDKTAVTPYLKFTTLMGPKKKKT